MGSRARFVSQGRRCACDFEPIGSCCTTLTFMSTNIYSEFATFSMPTKGVKCQLLINLSLIVCTLNPFYVAWSIIMPSYINPVVFLFKCRQSRIMNGILFSSTFFLFFFLVFFFSFSVFSLSLLVTTKQSSNWQLSAHTIWTLVFCSTLTNANACGWGKLQPVFCLSHPLSWSGDSAGADTQFTSTGREHAYIRVHGLYNGPVTQSTLSSCIA